MPSRGSPNGARHTRPQPNRPGRDRPEQVVVIDWNGWSSSFGTGGRHHPVRACGSKIDEKTGELKDDTTRNFIKQQLEAFAKFIERHGEKG